MGYQTIFFVFIFCLVAVTKLIVIYCRWTVDAANSVHALYVISLLISCEWFEVIMAKKLFFLEGR